jgi:serine phosphatase RsbU (regulator of sigma subunit)
MVLEADGTCELASAGHPAPFVNQQEIALPGALPLGLTAEAVYEPRTVSLQEGDHLVLSTDGPLEARAASGELYSFERLRRLMQRKPNAEEATKAATDFGQGDDITVLTLTRLARGETYSTLLKAPVLAPA